jgi:hypothetical protein
VTAEVAVSSGGQDVGAVLLLGPGGDDAGEYLHVAAIAALTEVAVAEARDETEQTLRGSFLEELRTRDDLDPHDVVRRARRLGTDLAEGAVALVADPQGRAAGRLVAAIASERPDALAQDGLARQRADHRRQRVVGAVAEDLARAAVGPRRLPIGADDAERHALEQFEQSLLARGERANEVDWVGHEGGILLACLC